MHPLVQLRAAELVVRLTAKYPNPRAYLLEGLTGSPREAFLRVVLDMLPEEPEPEPAPPPPPPARDLRGVPARVVCEDLPDPQAPYKPTRQDVALAGGICTRVEMPLGLPRKPVGAYRAVLLWWHGLKRSQLRQLRPDRHTRKLLSLENSSERLGDGYRPRRHTNPKTGRYSWETPEEAVRRVDRREALDIYDQQYNKRFRHVVD